MKSRSRDVRSTRREVQAMKRGHAVQLKGLLIRQMLTPEERAERDAEEAAFPLKDGTQADPRQAWVLPSNEQEK